MEGSENVQAQTQTMGEGVGSTEPTQSQNSTVSAAEPTEPTESQSAQPEEQTENVVEASAESSVEDTASTTEPPAPVFPQVDTFEWEKWDGSDYELFPEEVRPWANKLRDRHVDSLDSLTSTHKNEVDYWKRMYEALNYGDEDPRVAEYSKQIEELTAREKQVQDQLDSLNKEINAEREAENARYFSWFEKHYQSKLEQLASINGTETAEKMVLDLMDLGMEVHVSVDIALMGEKAVNTAKQLSENIKDSSLVLELLNSRFPNNNSNTVNKEEIKKETNPATQVVAGSAPVSRPAQLAKEKTPVYGTSNQRMASLMSAAENAIKKSKRR